MWSSIHSRLYTRSEHRVCLRLLDPSIPGYIRSRGKSRSTDSVTFRFCAPFVPIYREDWHSYTYDDDDYKNDDDDDDEISSLASYSSLSFKQRNDDVSTTTTTTGVYEIDVEVLDMSSNVDTRSIDIFFHMYVVSIVNVRIRRMLGSYDTRFSRFMESDWVDVERLRET